MRRHGGPAARSETGYSAARRFRLWVDLWATLVHFLTTSGCVQDPISLTSRWISAATAGFNSTSTIKKKNNKKKCPGSRCKQRPELGEIKRGVSGTEGTWTWTKNSNTSSGGGPRVPNLPRTPNRNQTPPPDENALRHICFTSAWSYSNSSLDASQTAQSRPLLRQPEL